MSSGDGGAVPVALIHGWGGSFRTTWQPLGWDRELAARGRPVIPVELLGHGDQPAPTDADAYERLPAAAWSQLGEAPLVDAIGFSLGGRVLLAMAGEQPHRFRRLVIAGMGGNVFRAVQADAIVAGMRAGVSSRLAPPVRAFVTYGMQSGNDPEALAACLARPADPIDPARLASIAAPTLLIAGEDDTFISDLDALAQALPSARVMRAPGVDHLATPYSPQLRDAAVAFLTA